MGPKQRPIYRSDRGNVLPKFMPISFFQACISFLRFFSIRDTRTKKIQVYTGMLPYLVPSWAQSMQICISFPSRSDLVLDADFYSISFYRRASRFVVFQTKAVHLCYMPLLTKEELEGTN